MPASRARQDRRREQRRVDGARRGRSRASRPEPRPASGRSRAASPSPSASSTRPARRAPAAPSSRPPSPAGGRRRPRPAISTCRPRASAEPAYSKRRSGVRWAETTRCSNGTSSAVERLGGVPHRLPVGARAHDQPDERRLGHAPTSVRLLDEQQRDRAGRLPHLGVGLVVGGDAVEDHDRLARGRAVLEADDREPAHGDVRVAGGELVQQRPVRVDVARDACARGPSSAISADPRTAGLSSSSPRRSSSSFWRKRNCAIER